MSFIFQMSTEPNKKRKVTDAAALAAFKSLPTHLMYQNEPDFLKELETKARTENVDLEDLKALARNKHLENILELAEEMELENVARMAKAMVLAKQRVTMGVQDLDWVDGLEIPDFLGDVFTASLNMENVEGILKKIPWVGEAAASLFRTACG